MTKTLNKPWEFQPGQTPWNKGTGGCKRGHDPSLYVRMPSGVYVCLGCKRENGAKYRAENKKRILFKNRLGRYGISAEEFETLWDKQNGACAVCGTSFNDNEYRIDHDHDTGKVRGLLCVSCNAGIGLLKDSPKVLLNAVKYLHGNDKGNSG